MAGQTRAACGGHGKAGPRQRGLLGEAGRALRGQEQDGGLVGLGEEGRQREQGPWQGSLAACQESRGDGRPAPTRALLRPCRGSSGRPGAGRSEPCRAGERSAKRERAWLWTVLPCLAALGLPWRERGTETAWIEACLGGVGGRLVGNPAENALPTFKGVGGGGRCFISSWFGVLFPRGTH